MQTFKIKQVAERFGISAHTLRFYDDEGLFPEMLRDEHGNRVFREENLEWIYLVLCLRNTGMPVAEIKRYIDLSTQGNGTARERYQMLLDQREKAEAEMREMQNRIHALGKKIAYYENLLQQQEEKAEQPA